MRFRDQVRWSRKWGAILLLLGALVFGAIYLLAENGKRELALALANFCTALVGMAAVLILFGGIARPVQKQFYHYAIEGDERYRRRMAANPFLRWFWWLDSEGRDRDA